MVACLLVCMDKISGMGYMHGHCVLTSNRYSDHVPVVKSAVLQAIFFKFLPWYLSPTAIMKSYSMTCSPLRPGFLSQAVTFTSWVGTCPGRYPGP